jgi:hypothetical protein
VSVKLATVFTVKKADIISTKRLSKNCSLENQSLIDVGTRLRAILTDHRQQAGSYNQSVF